MERIRYHVPEDGDDAAHPNVFELGARARRASATRRHFPLPGRFHLRFRRRVAGLEARADADDGAGAAPGGAHPRRRAASGRRGARAGAAAAAAAAGAAARAAAAAAAAAAAGDKSAGPRRGRRRRRARSRTSSGRRRFRSEPNLLGLTRRPRTRAVRRPDATAPAPAPAPMQPNNAPTVRGAAAAAPVRAPPRRGPSTASDFGRPVRPPVSPRDGGRSRTRPSCPATRETREHAQRARPAARALDVPDTFAPSSSPCG